ncbi:uncharacterized protein TRIREDRAFT_104200 [Trichoderma reesei QM6a]|uniref:Predicted protein n=2 Tax=Hypocrea jecorina TaxID=51453 RepID=G0RBQ7_HYPJQ|nr:uncharacterized protein TRIREDRAFT_104200 [Trichoderma reesei QM6a]EGR51096.1 predicted protein [Trichoderma reesei QM6a]ETS04736.1 hypothetical protein M419DRAFT_6561 [Trichoderma reesei RUT C-30]
MSISLPSPSSPISNIPSASKHPDPNRGIPQTEPEPADKHEPRASLLTLPTEIHLQIARLLMYPDALSLKYTNRYFHSFVDTGINLKVEWLVERRRLHLECPSHTHCELGTDLRFCRGSVALLMKRRREHIECESRPGLGCVIYGTATCPNRPRGVRAWQRWLGTKLTIELRWVLLAVLVLLCSWVYTFLSG